MKIILKLLLTEVRCWGMEITNIENKRCGGDGEAMCEVQLKKKLKAKNLTLESKGNQFK